MGAKSVNDALRALEASMAEAEEAVASLEAKFEDMSDRVTMLELSRPNDERPEPLYKVGELVYPTETLVNAFPGVTGLQGRVTCFDGDMIGVRWNCYEEGCNLDGALPANSLEGMWCKETEISDFDFESM